MFKRGSDSCKHSWSDEKRERSLDDFMWWRECLKCGEMRTTRSLNRGPMIEIKDWVSGMRYTIGSRQNLANQEFRYFQCDCGNNVRADFDLDDEGRVARASEAKCEWCDASYDAGS